MAVKTLIKQPAEVLKEVLPIGDGSAITAVVSVTSQSRGLVGGSQPLTVSGSIVNGELVVQMSGGTDAERYLVTGRASNAGGETFEAEFDVALLDGAWAMPDGGPAYLSISEFVAKFGLEEVVRLTDADGLGRIDKNMLVGALSDVQAIADVHVGALYAVPLATVPAVVKTAIADLARARLYTRGAPDAVDAAGKAALRLLERIAEGRLPLPSATVLTPAASTPAPVKLKKGNRQYSDGLEDY